MLPFLKNSKLNGIGGSAVESRKPDQEQPEEDQGLMSAANDLLRAIETKDAKMVAAALRAAFEIVDASPHEEGPHTNSDQEEE